MRQERVKQLLDLGLKYNGEDFTDDKTIFVNNLDVLCYEDEKWNETIEKIKERLGK